jgi:hypothetical protein
MLSSLGRDRAVADPPSKESYQTIKGPIFSELILDNDNDDNDVNCNWVDTGWQ